MLQHYLIIISYHHAQLNHKPALSIINRQNHTNLVLSIFTKPYHRSLRPIQQTADNSHDFNATRAQNSRSWRLHVHVALYLLPIHSYPTAKFIRAQKSNTSTLNFFKMFKVSWRKICQSAVTYNTTFFKD